MRKQFITNSATETKERAKAMAAQALKDSSLQKEAAVFALQGDLGGGKTTFTQGFAQGMGIKEKILSPTFVLMKKFGISENSCSNLCKFATFYHIDCYRLTESKEIMDLGLKEILSGPGNIVVIEWADKIKEFLPKNTIWIEFVFEGKNKRKLLIRRKS